MTRDGSITVTTPTDRDIEIVRVFNAPRPLVWQAMTKPELLKRWLLGPDGWVLAVCDIDLRVGGAYRYVWRKPNVPEMGMGGVFLEISAPERLVATERFDAAWYPGDAIDTTVLTERGERTTMTLTVAYETRAARDVALKSGMETGMEASYNRLAAILDEPAR